MTGSATECLASANELLAAHSALITRARASQLSHRRQLRALPSPPQELLKLPLFASPPRSPERSPPSSPILVPKAKPLRPDLPPAKRARVARYANYVPEEETIRNDYSQRYVDGGEWPQNWVLGADPEHRFEEYPKQQRLLTLKKISVNEHAVPPTYLPFADLSTLHPSKFDVILIDPPFSSSFTWDDLQDLQIPALAADPSFVLLWVGSGSGDGLERGREVLAKWGFRRCEDIVWVKSNATSNRGPGTDPPTTSLLTRTKQHCLMGIRGTVRRSTDSWFVHCNVDTDVMIWEGDPSDPTLKPPEMYTLIENFCLGLRRLEVFGRARTMRRGWVSALAEGEDACVAAGDAPGAVRWEREAWEAQVRELAQGGKAVVPMTPEIDALRPKSPVRGGPPGGANNSAGHGGAGGLPLVAAPMGGPAGQGGARGTFGGGPRMLPPQMMNDGGMMGWQEMGMPMGMPMGMMNMAPFGMQNGGMPMGNMGNMAGGMGGMAWDGQFGEGAMWDTMGDGMMGMGGMGSMGGNMGGNMGGGMAGNMAGNMGGNMAGSMAGNLAGNMGMRGNMGMGGGNMGGGNMGGGNMGGGNMGMGSGMSGNMGNMGMGMGQWTGDAYDGGY